LIEHCEFCGKEYDIIEDMRSEWHESGYCLIVKEMEEWENGDSRL